jgi:histidinol dehydrogenase
VLPALARADVERLARRAPLGGDAEAAAAVAPIVAAVEREGDDAVRRYTAALDGRTLPAGDYGLGRAVMEEALAALERDDARLVEALRLAAARIRAYHECQRAESYELADGPRRLRCRVLPLARAGVYAPGGRALYPSTVMMSAIPARVAGVGVVVLCSPAAAARPLLAAAALAGVDRAFPIGGAQAVAALAYGTATVPRADKIVGPGNRYVAAAKRLVAGRVGVDLEAGPSEVVVVADASADPAAVALDLCAQAEHDPDALVVCLAVGNAVADAVADATAEALESLEAAAPAAGAVARRALARGGVHAATDRAAALALAEALAPEHLQLAVERPEEALAGVPSAAAVFLGDAPAALGDYLAGTNHVLPTGGSARFSSPLRVADFQRLQSVVAYERSGLAADGPVAARIARAEGLEAHARALERRR